jgi:tetratricopeptide (TPR) repeat protein
MEETEYLSFGAQDWYERGQRFTQDGRHREAIEALDQAIAQDPSCAEAYFARGACYYTLGRYEQAGDDIDAAAILGCRDAQFWSKHSIHSITNCADDRQD